jgi:hypothetical protein
MPIDSEQNLNSVKSQAIERETMKKKGKGSKHKQMPFSCTRRRFEALAGYWRA